ncbi:hypothetical protein [uncultured Aquimarina sp.]|uniref:hypothetical protein n=1 Tax=uncultured Aquimarina sp. TaxID=575652 RepID=UPI002631DBDC|nr:hypothetical protein [uncultured Aquimarina sp.]
MNSIVKKNKVLLGCLLCFFSLSCNYNKSRNSESEKISSIETKLRDTLTIGYTYWWLQSGPFIGNCGEKYSLVVLGTIDEIYKKTEQERYVSQTGIIKIDEVLIAGNLENKTYQEEEFIASDCFNQVDVKKGDKVIVFFYEYEGSISIPGGKSILKINGRSDPKIQSIKKYIQSDQNPLSIEEDLHLWEEIGLGSELTQIISCKKLVSKSKL